MSKLKTRVCEKCRRTFKTQANYLSTCDFCIADETIKEGKNDPSSTYYKLKSMFDVQSKKWTEMKAIERGFKVMEFWLDFFEFNKKTSWKKIQYYNYLLEIQPEFQLTKFEFDAIKLITKK